jgi:hypothetical protein
MRFALKVFIQFYWDYVDVILLKVSLNWCRTEYNGRQRLKIR